MNRIIILIAVLALSCDVIAGRKCRGPVDVVTNANGSITYTSDFHSEEIPDATKISMTFSMNTNAAVRIMKGSIPKMDRTMWYAKQNGDNYINVSNSYLRCVRMSAGYTYNFKTNRYEWSPPGYFEVVSNRVFKRVFSATAIDGTQYESVRDKNGYYYLQAVTNKIWRARIAPSACSDSRRRMLLGEENDEKGKR